MLHSKNRFLANARNEQKIIILHSTETDRGGGVRAAEMNICNYSGFCIHTYAV